MEITLVKQTTQLVTVEVELPYYFEHDLSDDYGESIIYGKIEEKLYTTIHESKRYGDLATYEIEKEEHVSIALRGLSSYFEEEHQSTKEEFEAAKQRCLKFLSEF